jgi:aminoglycoside/choline kinase family phosphotransferase/GTP:adenosylcobinamide-phosphate guanylyltransferase
MKALILAAGLGTRLQPYTNYTPKPLFTLAGRPVLDVIIDQLQQAGCKAVIINTHHLHQDIEAFVAAQNYSLPVSTRFEPEILGTGGAIKNVADFWDLEPFMVINADIVADIDLDHVYQAHCRSHPAATLVLCDNPAFNSVAVNQDKWIQGFRDRGQMSGQTTERLLTFTGIQVLEPRVLDYIPANTSYSSIDAFKKMLADNKKLQAYIAPNGKWQDIGTPERYRQTAYETILPRAFRRAFGDLPGPKIEKRQLKGDGSERQWFRLKTGHHSLIMADHGIRQSRSITEVDAFVHIGEHLYRQGVCVPKIYYYDTFSGLVFLEDLGDTNLQQTVRATDNAESLIALYKPVIDQLVKLALRGADKFDPDWTYQTARYDRELIVEKECRYFQEAFLKGYLGFRTPFEALAADFELLAQKALQHSITGFLHRDMQSRNIMIKNHQVHFIDFQGGRLGPIQYDLASLLIDPYVELADSIQVHLREYCIDALSAITVVNSKEFRSCFHYCTLTRNLQILGAFSFLSRVKGKHYFEKYIPASLQTLKSALAVHGQDEFHELTAVVEKAHGQLQKTGNL